MKRPAILGGPPALPEMLLPFNSIGAREKALVNEVVDSGCLSDFHGSWGDNFRGGPKVRMLEKLWSERFRIPHSVSMNSATSGLFAAVGAVGVEPGDEVIVSPYTMSASAVAPLVYGGVPVFADIEPETFCIDPAEVSAKLSQKTKAIIAVNLFGHPARLRELRKIADEHGIYLIEDNAQAPLAAENDVLSGTIGHIGVFSLNCHKHIQTGEGGICTTDDESLAQRLQLIRNHGENVVADLNISDISNLIGYNFRLTELSAAVGIGQIERIDDLVESRRQLGESLTERTFGHDGFSPPAVRDGCRHVYYVWSAKYDETEVGLSREAFSRALTAECVPHFVGYVTPIYMLPAFQRKIGLGRGGYPFSLADHCYDKGLCPVAERMHERELLCFEICAYEAGERELDSIGEAFRKIFRHREELAQEYRRHLKHA